MPTELYPNYDGKYRHEADPTWILLVDAELEKIPLQDGSLRIEGKCPRCGDPTAMTIAAGTVATGVANVLSEACGPEEEPLACECTAPHEGRDPKDPTQTGCGVYGNISVTRE